MEERKLFFSPENLPWMLNCVIYYSQNRISNAAWKWFTMLETEQVRALAVYKEVPSVVSVHGFEAGDYEFKARLAT